MNLVFFIFQRVLRIIAALMVLMLVTSLFITLFQVRVELDSLRKPLQDAAQKALGRDIQFRGKVSMTPTLWPILEIQDVQIANPPGWKKDTVFATASLIRVQLGLLPLLNHEFQAVAVTAKGIVINPQNNWDGDSNWRFRKTDKPLYTVKKISADEAKISFEALEELTMEAVSIHYLDQQLPHSLHFQFATLTSAVARYSPLLLDVKGNYENQPYVVNFQGGNIADLFDDSEPWAFKLTADIKGAPVRVDGLRSAGNNSEVKASITIGNANIGKFLDWLESAEEVEAVASEITAQTVLRGASLYGLLKHSEFQITMKNGSLLLTDANTGDKLPIAIKKGAWQATPGVPMSMVLDSAIDKVPLTITIQAAALADYTRSLAELPLMIKIRGEDFDLQMQTRSKPSSKLQNLGFIMSLKGYRLDSINQLLHLDLPPWGPYSIAGIFKVTEQGYSISDLVVEVVDSRVQGNLVLATRAKPLKLVGELESWQIQINDFFLDNWTLVNNGENDQFHKGMELGNSVHSLVNKKTHFLLSEAVLTSLDADIEMRIRQVLSGTDPLGEGRLKLNLQKGRLALELVQMVNSEEIARAHFDFYPSKDIAEVVLQASVDKLDYGIFARRIDPNSGAAGKLSFDIDINAQTAALDRLLVDGSGHFKFAVWPENMQVGVFELWPANLMNALISNVNKGEAAKVNCVVAGFNLLDGVMHENVLFVDTPEMQMHGDAAVNFNTETVAVNLAPEAKFEKLPGFSAKEVEGNFKDFGVRINPKQSLFVNLASEKEYTACITAWQKVKTKDNPPELIKQ